MTARAPLGYVQLSPPGARVIARGDIADAILHTLSRGTIYDWAAAQPGKRVLQGRLPVYAVTLPFNGQSVVVRRNTHGGMLAAWRGDRFFATGVRPELHISLALASVHIPAAEVVAHAIYRVNALERRVDVVTRELPPGLDLGAAITSDAPDDLHRARLEAVTSLLAQLASYGVWHQDLNVKNVYLIEEASQAPRAALLDVDRVRFHPPGALVARANGTRLIRSLRKWRARHNARVSDDDLAEIGRAAEGVRILPEDSDEDGLSGGSTP